MQDELLALLAARRGHFRLESGHHGDLWLDLDPLFLRPARLRRYAAALARRLAGHGVEVVCGPLTGGAFVAQLVAAELDAAFAYAERRAPERGAALYAVEYRLPAALRSRASGKAVAIVDDAINAGSAVRATHADLLACVARPVALGALLVLGTPASRFAVEQGLPLETVAVLDNTVWEPSDCPLCSGGIPLEEVG
jgi:orotate phosphoribosyltransferase